MSKVIKQRKINTIFESDIDRDMKGVGTANLNDT